MLPAMDALGPPGLPARLEKRMSVNPDATHIHVYRSPITSTPLPGWACLCGCAIVPNFGEVHMLVRDWQCLPPPLYLGTVQIPGWEGA